MIRARFSPFLPGLLIGLGGLLVVTGIFDGVPLVWLPGSALLAVGVAWFLRQRQLYRFALRSGGSSPRKPDGGGHPDDYNDTIVTRG